MTLHVGETKAHRKLMQFLWSWIHLLSHLVSEGEKEREIASQFTVHCHICRCNCDFASNLILFCFVLFCSNAHQFGSNCEV